MTPIDFTKPDLTKPLAKPDLTLENMAEKKGTPLKGMQQFMKARKTTEEMYSEISNNANMTINTWMNLIGASTMAAGGLITGALVFIVAAMLVSPIMGPILGMTMGYRVADFQLFRTGFFNELKMAICTFLCGCVFGVVLGDVGKTYKWPNNSMLQEGQAFNLVISILVSAAAGMVLGVSLTSSGGNALVGTAISAGLLPPLVNAGMMYSYATAYAAKSLQGMFYATGTYNILFYLTHVVTIIVVANFVFWLKDIDPRFREGDDSNFNDVPSLVEHRLLLEEQGKELTERQKAEYFFENVKADLRKDVTEFASGIKSHVSKATDFAQAFIGGKGGVGASIRRRSSRAGSTASSHEEEEVRNPVISRAARRGDRSVNFSLVSTAEEEEGEGDIEMQQQGSADHGRSVKVSQIEAFYRRYNPSKLAELSTILARYEGKEDELLVRLHRQYNVAM